MRAITLVLSLLFAFNIGTYAQNNAKDTIEVDYKLMGAYIPPFKIKTANNKIYENKDFDHTKRIVFVLFNPTCGHCKAFAELVAKNEKQLKNIAILFIGAPNVHDQLNEFAQKTGLDKVKNKNIILATDDTKFFEIENHKTTEFLFKVFEYRLPQINIYNQERKLTNKFRGDLSYEEILEVLK